MSSGSGNRWRKEEPIQMLTLEAADPNLVRSR